MSFELKPMSTEERMTTEEKQQYFEQLCQMDEAELRKLFENSNLYIKLKNLMNRFNDTQSKKHTMADVISERNEVLFHGKRKDNSEWIEGFLFQTQERTYIAYAKQFDDDLFLSPKNIFIEVIPETVGRFTGLSDKNGKKIFVGNTLKVSLNYFEEDTGTVIFQDGAYGVKFNRLFLKEHNHFMTFHALKTCYKGDFELIEP